MKKILAAILIVVVVLAVVMLVRASTMESLQDSGEIEAVSLTLPIDEIAGRFAGALTFPTVSPQDPAETDSLAFYGLHHYLAETYPLVHSQLESETVAELSLLFRWPGTDRSLEPILLMGHLDVVPVIPGTEDDWTHPPFGGVQADGFVWGRGAMDDKSSVIGILEATERLLSEGFQPRRTVYLAFGHDEEVGGPNGAAKIAEVLAARGVDTFAFVLDEGGAIAEDMIPGMEGPVAIIGVAEKGFLSLELLVEGEGGHSSMPPDHTNIGILAAALTRLENNQFPARLDGATEQMFRYLTPEMSLLRRVVFANLWLLRPVVSRLMVVEQSGAAMVRTTTAATMIDGGVKDNVLPIAARAVVNFRIMPGETVESVTARVRDVIADDRVQLRTLSNQDPSPVSDADSEAFHLLSRTLRQVVPDPDLKIAPYLVVGGTDAKYYSGRSANVYRFLAVRAGGDDLESVHGTNERLSLHNLELNVKYFYQLLRNAEDL